jgi:hypothetical protein
MKTKWISQFSVLNILVATLFAASPVRAQITGIDAANSFSTNIFSDSTSFNALLQPGANYVTSANPWNGSAVGINNVTDPTTGDFANASLNAAGGGFVYSVALNNVTLTQTPTDTGHADSIYFFQVAYSLGGGGLPSQATLFPNLQVSGIIQNTGASFASLTGYIDYYDVDVSGVYTLLDTVNYSFYDNTPGTFINVPVNSSFINGTTPVLPANSTLVLFGYFDFKADPASLSVETVPEASSSLLLGLAGVGGILWRRLAVKQTALPAN